MERPSKTLEIIFVIETSSNTYGSIIGTINTAIEELVPEIKEIAESRTRDRVNIRCLSYSSGSKWHCLDHIPATTFRWEYLEGNGKSDLGSACLRLNKFLAENDFSVDTHYRPIIFLFNVSQPTDNIKYALYKLKENEWYKRALKVGIAIGDNSRVDMLSEFTGNARNVMTIHNPEALKKWINFFETR